jgi:hypothetical protein
MGIEYWGLAVFGFCLTTSILISITCITNSTSGNTAILDEITPFATVFPFVLIIFCVAFSLLLKGMADSPETRKITLYLFICFTYILSMLTLHLSTFIINLTYT